MATTAGNLTKKRAARRASYAPARQAPARTAPFGTPIATVDTAKVEKARSATLAARQRIKEADARERRTYLGETKHFLGLKKTKSSPAATVAAVRVLGFLEDESAVPLL